MKRFLRWFLILLLLVIVGLGVGGWVVRRRMLTRPTWYGRPPLDPRQARAAANRMDQKLIDTFSAARSAEAREVRAQRDGPTTNPSDLPPDQVITFSVTEEELNAFFSKWRDSIGLDGNFGGKLTDPVLALDDQTLILAATVQVKQLDAVVSLKFVPRLEAGKLNVGFEKVMAGTLEAPRSYFSRYASKITAMVNERLPEARKEANISPHGWANSAAVEAAMGELLIRALDAQPAEPVLFLPEPDGQEGGRALPVKIVGIDIRDKTLTLKVQPMTPAEREQLLGHLRGEGDAPPAP